MIDVDNSSSFSIDEVNVKSYITQMLKFLKVNTKSDVSVLFVDEDEMAKQHVRWMNEPGPTDVMSFPMDDIVLQDSKLRKKQAILGDIIICPAVALRDSKEQGINPAYHLGINECLHCQRAKMAIRLTGFKGSNVSRKQK